ncbi:hypothetical protein BpHYR1_003877 [Brachionus plicatilis]|uniref:Uncharacterized protein n=1 Tax=Brachionus plicatilis TaxID=10195 RepID=A0A3M7Q6H6_BRAPC|nr:hypothetical protein BpHYR1_003877 [Brachionus plicatilis]
MKEKLKILLEKISHQVFLSFRLIFVSYPGVQYQEHIGTRLPQMSAHVYSAELLLADLAEQFRITMEQGLILDFLLEQSDGTFAGCIPCPNWYRKVDRF